MVVSTQYIDDCLTKNERLEPEDYLLVDPVGEEKQNFKLNDAVSRAKNHRGRLLHGMSIYCTEPVKGGFDTYKAIIEANGGTCILYKARAGSTAASKASGPDEDSDDMDIDDPEYVYLVSGSTPAEVALWPKFRQMVQGTGKLARITETDWLLNSALRQELHWDDVYELK